MSKPDWKKARDVFEKCISLPLEQRNAFLESACEGDELLLSELRRMLDGHAAAKSDFLEWPTATKPSDKNPDAPHRKPDRTSGEQPQHELPRTRSIKQSSATRARTIGPYKLLEEIGHGGMGEVWLAQQSHPVSRRVAIKLIKSEFSGRSEIARFEAEQQALALMEHPNIAKVFDAGTTDDGTPWFAMEYIHGAPITEYCDRNRLGIEKRLQLFIPICRAVQHAHQKGIIHRDLKPANILIADKEGGAVPKVIDFGLAKATDHQRMLTDKTVYTEVGKVLGTLQYMSPEQAALNSRDIDTRTDVYSLGVVLYELLVGNTPLDKKSVQDMVLQEILVSIQEIDPERPSARIWNSKETNAITGNRSVSNSRLTQVLRGDLDWIVMKALEKDRGRRYDTAIGLANDVQRFLSNDPVTARPPSTAYRLRKFARKHRAGVFATSLVAVALVAGLVTTTLQRNRAIAAEKLADQRLETERKAKTQAREKEKEALAAAERENMERQYAEAIANFLKFEFLALTSESGQWRFGQKNWYELNRNSSLRDLLDRAAHRLPLYSDKLDPRTKAELSWVIGVTYRDMKEYDLAIPFLEDCVRIQKKHLGEHNVKTLNSQNSLALAIEGKKGARAALRLIEETYRDGKEHLDAVEFFSGMYTVPYTLAAMYQKTGQSKRAIATLRENLKAAEEHFEHDSLPVCSAKVHLASTLITAGKLDEAETIMGEIVPIFETKHRSHPEYYKAASLAGVVAHAKGDFNGALKVFEKLSDDPFLRRLGTDFVNTTNLATQLASRGQVSESIAILEQAESKAISLLGPDDSTRLLVLSRLGVCYHWANRHDEAVKTLNAVVQLSRDQIGRELNGSRFRTATSSLIACCVQSDLRSDLEDLVRQEADLFGRREYTGLAGQSELAVLGLGLLSIGETRRAETVLRKCVSIGNEMTPNYIHFLAQLRLGEALIRQGKLAEADELVRTARGALSAMVETIPVPAQDRVILESLSTTIHLQERLVPDSKSLADLSFELGIRHGNLEQWAEAESAFANSLRLKEKYDSPETSIQENRSLLGWSIAHQLESGSDERRQQRTIELLKSSFLHFFLTFRSKSSDAPLADQRDDALQRLTALPSSLLATALQGVIDQVPDDEESQLDLASIFDVAGQDFARQSKWAEAEALFEANLAIKTKYFQTNWQRQRAETLLGWAIANNSDTRSKERDRRSAKLLVDGYTGLKKSLPDSWVTPAALEMLVMSDEAIRRYDSVLDDVEQQLVDYELEFHTKEAEEYGGKTHYAEFARWLKLFRGYSHVLLIRDQGLNIEQMSDEARELFAEVSDPGDVVSDSFRAVELAHKLFTGNRTDDAQMLLDRATDHLRSILLKAPHDGPAEAAFRRAHLSKFLLFKEPKREETVEVIQSAWRLPENVLIELALADGRTHRLKKFANIPAGTLTILGIRYEEGCSDESMQHLISVSDRYPVLDIGIRGWKFDQDLAIEAINKCMLLNAFWLNFNSAVTHEHLAGLDSLPLLRTVGFWYSENVDDRCLTYLARQTGLEAVNLTGGKISAEGIRNLHYLKHVGILWIAASKDPETGKPTIDDQALRAIGEWPDLNLRELGLTSAAVTDQGLMHLARMINLTRINLEGTKISGAGFSELTQVPLDSLELNNTLVNDKSAGAIGKLPNLQMLQISGTQISEQFLISLPDGLPLKQIVVPAGKVSEKDSRELETRWSGCKITRK